MEKIKVGDLVQERLPLMAGDAPARVGVVTDIERSYPLEHPRWYKILFVDRVELVAYNDVKKVEA